MSIYSEGIYESGDLDFVSHDDISKIEQVLEKIGFNKEGKYFSHPKCKYFIEFVSPPVGIGDDVNIRPRKYKVDGEVIKIFSPTDCIRDRLASYMYFKSRDCLDQAVLVAKNQDFQARKIKEWCKNEGFLDVYEEFLSLVKSNK